MLTFSEPIIDAGGDAAAGNVRVQNRRIRRNGIRSKRTEDQQQLILQMADGMKQRSELNDEVYLYATTIVS